MIAVFLSENNGLTPAHPDFSSSVLGATAEVLLK